MLKILKIAAGVLASASFFTLVAPVVGEVIATLPPPFPIKAARSAIGLDMSYEEVSFPTSDGLMLRGWFIPAPQANAPAIVYAPATRHDQRSGLSLVPDFHAASYHVLLFSYRGHGRSDGRRGFFTYGSAESQDLDAAVRFLSEVKGIRRVGVIGHSAGAVAAILSAARNPRIGAVTAVAPFTCITEVWNANRPPFVPPLLLNWALWVAERRSGFDRDDVCPIDVIDQIAPRPLLVIHGTADQRISPAQVVRLFAAARQPKLLWFVKGATHSSIRSPALDQLATQVIRFFDAALKHQGRIARSEPRPVDQFIAQFPETETLAGQP